ncbi:MAG: hypothetical protein L0099_02990 [Acidobacteria bacterium]|nr:hypothetical protein [Acidobacteriota bacterium]
MLWTTGCATGPFARQPAAALPTRTPSAPQLIAHLNQNSHAVHSIECEQVHIQVKQGIQAFGLDGMLAYEKPRRFRLVAEAANTTQADMGSNDTEFWFWVKKADPPALYHCTYEDFPRCRSLRIPIHPDWVAEALCLTEFGPAEQYRMQRSGNNLELVSSSTSPQGQPLTKVTVVSLETGRIVRQHLKNAQGRDLWMAEISDHQRTREGFVLPRKVTIRCPEEKMELSLRLDGCKVNSLGQGGVRTALFRRPEMRGVQTINLAQGPAATQSLPKVRGAGSD